MAVRRQPPQTATRPEPMNASPHHSKVKVSLALSDAVYIAGGLVSGKMEMECKAGAGSGPGDTLGIGVMMVELVAIQELTSRDHSATSTFLHRRRLFQGPGLPPSNAVLPMPLSSSPSSLPPLPPHYHVARRGQTTFFFRIPLPRRSPASIAFGGGLATVRYEVRATVGVWWKGERRLVVDRKPVEVVESYSVEDTEEADAAGWTGEKVVVGEGGKLWVQGKIVGGVGGGAIVAGESACVELQVKNHGNRKTTGLQITLLRHLHLPSLSTSSAKPIAKLEISDTLATVPYRGSEYCVHAGGEGVAALVFDVPRAARSVRGGPRHSSSPSSDDEDLRDTDGDQSRGRVDALFEIRCTIAVKVLVGLGAKDVVLELPVRVVHPLAMPALEDHPMVTPPLNYPGSPPMISPHAQQHTWIPHPSQPPPLFPPQQQQPWLPHPSQTPVPGPYQYFSPPIITNGAGQQFYFPPPPMSPAHPMSPAPPLPMSPPPQMFPPPLLMSPPHTHFPMRPKSAGAGLMPGYVPHARAGSPLPIPPAQQQHHQFSAPAPIFSPPPLPGRRPLPSAGVMSPTPPIEEASPGEGEEGKGLIASRVSHHLRLTSRHRSVSPRSHRFPVPQPDPVIPPVPTLPAPVPAVPSHSHSRSAVSGMPTPTPSTPMRPISGLPTTGEVVSPRPILSPAQSYSNERRHSRNVEELERMVAVDVPLQDIQHAGGMEERSTENTQKTLPRPPVPSDSGKPIRLGIKDATTPKPRAAPLFASIESPNGNAFNMNNEGLMLEPSSPAPAPPTPQLTAVTPRGFGLGFGLGAELSAHPTHSRNEFKDGVLSGLDALERRLLAEVGTRKIGTDERRVDVRNVLSLDASADAVEDSIGGGHGRVVGIAIPVAPVEPLNDSAISSLTLADHLDRAQEDQEVLVRPVEDNKERENDEDEDEDQRTHHAGRSDGEELGSRSMHRRWQAEGTVRGDDNARVGRKRGRGTAAPPDREKVESRNMRKTAKSRVAAWLGGIDPADLEFDGVDEGLDPTIDPEGAADVGSAVVAAEDVRAVAADLQQEAAAEQLPTRKLAPATDEEDEGEQDQPSFPNPRSSGFVPIGSAKADEARRQSGFREPKHKAEASSTLPKRPPLPVFPPSSQKVLDPEVKYDIRSARGGRGGRVTAVASIWASQTSQQISLKPPPQKSAPEPKLRKPVVESKAEEPVVEHRAHNFKPRTHPPKPVAGNVAPPSKKAPSPSRTPEPDFNNARRALGVKSTSAPATVSSSHATPTLSSTASLARPTPRVHNSKAPFKILPSVVEALPEVVQVPAAPAGSAVKLTPVTSGGDLAFGKARLRDLIKKYQGQST